MCNAWIVRPYPHGKYRIKEFLANNMIAIGWPGIGDLSSCIGLDDIKSRLLAYYKHHSSRSLESSISIRSVTGGETARILNDFANGYQMLCVTEWLHR